MMTSSSAAERGAPSCTGFLPGLEPAPGSCTGAQEQDASAALALEQSQALLKRRLTRPLVDLFQQLTGLHLHLCWHELVAQRSQSSPVRLCPQPRQPRATVLLPTCQECRGKRWLPEWNLLQWEKPVPGRRGLTNYCACLRLQEQPVLTLLVQQPPSASRAAKQASSRAISLIRLVVHDLHATLQAGRAVAELDNLHEVLAAGGCSRDAAGPDNSQTARWKRRLPKTLFQKPDLRGRRTKTDQSPLKSAASATAGRSLRREGRGQPEPRGHRLNGNHRQQLVQRMLDYIHQHYCRPIQLHHLAVAMNLNPSYVSSLFSTTLGVTFHHYLEQLRITRAKDFLRDPVKRVSDVAYAVGYPNANHFRNVFATRVGVPPSAWRETQAA